MAEPPHDAIDAFLGNAFARQIQHEFLGNLEALDMQPNAAGGYVGDEAIARQGAGRELDLGDAIDKTAL